MPEQHRYQQRLATHHMYLCSKSQYCKQIGSQKWNEYLEKSFNDFHLINLPITCQTLSRHLLALESLHTALAVVCKVPYTYVFAILWPPGLAANLLPISFKPKLSYSWVFSTGLLWGIPSVDQPTGKVLGNT